MDKLFSGQKLFDDVKPGAEVRFAPTWRNGDSLRSLASTPDFKLVVQTAFLLKGRAYTEADRLELFNKLSKIDSLSGVTYYSESRNKETILFDRVFRVAKPGSHKPLPYPQFDVMPANYHMMVHIKDVNFGSTWYSVSIESNSSSITISLENAMPLGMLVLQAFDAGGVRMRFTLVHVDEGLLVSGVCAANPSTAVSAFVDMFSAIQKRVLAVEGWVFKQVENRSGDSISQGG